MKNLSAFAVRKRRTIGFVPTMGYLHEGHISLVREAARRNDMVVVSIFVNPAQFGPKEDLKKYPRDLIKDVNILKKHKVDIIFCPKAGQIYPKDYRTYVEVKRLSEAMCGLSRPSHFRGVATIVTKLFNIVRPSRAYFGAKDFQQSVIIRQMVKDLNMDTEIIVMPIIREKDGLAMSSRNVYLKGNEREKALALNKALKFAQALIGTGVRKASKVKRAMEKLILVHPGVKIDYISICDPDTLEEKDVIKGRTLIALAAYVGKTRLIDNIITAGRAYK